MSEVLTNDEKADVLDKVADLLWLHGRCKGEGQDDQGRFCVRGAICEVLGVEPSGFGFWRHPSLLPVVVVLDTYLARHPEVLDRYAGFHVAWVERGSYPSWAWSDGTDDDELVIDTVRRCAKELREAS